MQDQSVTWSDGMLRAIVWQSSLNVLQA